MLQVKNQGKAEKMTTKKDKEEDYIPEGVWIICRGCGCKYIDDLEWIKEVDITNCPYCGQKLKVV